MVRGDAEHGQDEGGPPFDEMMKAAFALSLLELPGPAESGLVYDAAAGRAAMQYLYRLCQVLADRSLTEDEARAICVANPLPPTTADALLSMDVALRHLPELYKLARSMGETDPMVGAMERLAMQFPLSTVGIPSSLPPDLSVIRSQPVIWGLYLDRVLERQDESRIIGPEMQEAVRSALGTHVTLAPKLSAQLALMT